MIDGGVEIIQLRGKQYTAAKLMNVATRLRAVTRDAGVPFVINDHPDIAREVDADGVHVGQDDMSIKEARQRAGAKCFVGRSTHSPEQAVRAAAEAADYIGFGPLFATPTKPDYAAIGLSDIARVYADVPLPIFCIGGIKLGNLSAVVAAGAQRVVIVSELLQAGNIAKYAAAARALLGSQPLTLN
jgi:thiamine-phosphate pyrophosphorylase